MTKLPNMQSTNTLTNNKILYYFELAKTTSNQSKDPSRQIGAVAIGQFGQVLSTSYNGFPRGIQDTPERYNDRPTKYKYVLHAESNLITNACLSGVSLYNSDIFVYGLPVCSECAKLLIQIKPRIIYSLGEIDPRWKESYEFTIDLFKEAGIMYKHYENEGEIYYEY